MSWSRKKVNRSLRLAVAATVISAQTPAFALHANKHTYVTPRAVRPTLPLLADLPAMSTAANGPDNNPAGFNLTGGVNWEHAMREWGQGQIPAANTFYGNMESLVQSVGNGVCDDPSCAAEQPKDVNILVLGNMTHAQGDRPTHQAQFICYNSINPVWIDLLQHGFSADAGGQVIMVGPVEYLNFGCPMNALMDGWLATPPGGGSAIGAVGALPLALTLQADSVGAVALAVNGFTLGGATFLANSYLATAVQEATERVAETEPVFNAACLAAAEAKKAAFASAYGIPLNEVGVVINKNIRGYAGTLPKPEWDGCPGFTTIGEACQIYVTAAFSGTQTCDYALPPPPKKCERNPNPEPGPTPCPFFD